MGFVDIHSHILPGMDDGARDLEQSLQMLHMAWKEGISHIIATPHYKRGKFPAQRQTVLEQAERLREAARERGIPVHIYCGTEIFYHSELEERLDSRKLWTLNGSEYVLVEFLPLEEYFYIRNAVDNLLGMGYRPVLAHAERYQCFLKDTEKVEEIKGMGCRIQVNAGSVAGKSGHVAGRFVKGLIHKELVDYLGTDAHDLKKRRPAMNQCAAYLYKKCSREYADALLYGNAMSELLGDCAYGLETG